MTAVYILAIVVCVLLSGFFSASEMSFSSVNRLRLERAAEEGKKSARTGLAILDHFDDALSAILVCNNLVNIAASSLGSVTVLLIATEQYTWVATTLITAAVIVFGETIPKILAKKMSTRFALLFAVPLRALMVILKPVTFVVVGLVDLITKRMKGEQDDSDDSAAEELHSIIDTAEDEDVLDEGESKLVSRAIDFADISASQIMTARVDILGVDVKDDWQEILATVDSSPYSRIPVYEGSIDTIIGVLTVNHFLKAVTEKEPVDIRSLLLPACYVYKTMKLPAVLEQLRSSQQHLAIVTDEYGGTLGVVSMEDVLEELVGEIWDETDVVAPEIQPVDDAYRIDGDTAVEELWELFSWPAETDFESTTVGGWCIEMLGGFPDEGASFTYKDVEFTVTEVEERRVRSVVARKTAKPDGEEDGGAKE